MNRRGSINTIVVFSAMILASAAALGQSLGATPTLPGKGVAGPDHNVQHSFADQAFVKLVLERAAADEQLGQLAQQKSQSPDIKDLGEKLVENRAALNVQFKTLAQNLDVAPPKGPSKKDSQMIAKLTGLSGPQFDEEFLKAAAKSNRDHLKNFQAESQNADDPNLQRSSQEDVPVITKFSQSVDDAAKAHNVALDDKK
jgi:putative membrane protein